jgi:hypothetical protein
MLDGFGACCGESTVYAGIGENEAPVYGESSFSCDASYWDSTFRRTGIHFGLLMSPPVPTCIKEFRDVGSSTGKARVAILSCWVCNVERVGWCHRCREAEVTTSAARPQNPGADLFLPNSKYRLGHRLWIHADVVTLLFVNTEAINVTGMLDKPGLKKER